MAVLFGVNDINGERESVTLTELVFVGGRLFVPVGHPVGVLLVLSERDWVVLAVLLFVEPREALAEVVSLGSIEAEEVELAALEARPERELDPLVDRVTELLVDPLVVPDTVDVRVGALLDALPVVDRVDVRETVIDFEGDPLTLDVRDTEIERVDVGQAEALRVPLAETVILTVVRVEMLADLVAVAVLEILPDTLAVAEAVVVLEIRGVRVPATELVDVLDIEVLPVEVTVMRGVRVGGAERDTVGLPVEVLEARMEAVALPLPDELLLTLDERVPVPEEVDVFDEDTEAVGVFVTNDVLVELVLEVPVFEDVVVFVELELDVIVLDGMDVYEGIRDLAGLGVRAGLADAMELARADRVLVPVRVDVLEALEERVGSTGPPTTRKRED